MRFSGADCEVFTHPSGILTMQLARYLRNQTDKVDVWWLHLVVGATCFLSYVVTCA